MSNKENIKEYQSMKNKWVISWRLNARKYTLLQKLMKEDGWTNRSGFLDFKIFGEPDVKIQKLIEEKDPENIALLLRNEMLELADNYIYIKFRYNKDMSQLYQEEGVDLKQWIAKTNKWHSELVKKTEETFKLCRKIAKALGLDDYFKMPSDENPGRMWGADKETQDKMAEQLRREHIALGLGDIIDN